MWGSEKLSVKRLAFWQTWPIGRQILLAHTTT
jgi:hypothetical protein